MCIKQILSESDYDLIITKSLKSRDRKKLEEYLENLFKHNIEHNRKFWVYLSDALRDNNQLSDEEYGSIIDVSYLEREWRIDQLTTPFERHLFLYNYINLRIEDLLIERNHNDAFQAYMDKYLPNWRTLKDELNKLPVSHIDWCY